MEKAATRHSLGLSRQQLQLLAQDAFRDVGVRLQERRHLDLIYNFGCHLTDDYRPGRKLLGYASFRLNGGISNPLEDWDWEL